MLLLAAPAAATVKVAVTVAPTTLELSSQAKTRAKVLVANEGDEPICKLRIVPVSSGANSLKPVLSDQPEGALMPGAGRVYTLNLSPWAEPVPTPSLTLVTHFESEDGVEHALLSPVGLSPPTPFDAGKAASIEVKASLGALRSDHSEPVYLLVANRSGLPLTVEEVEASGPSFIEFEDLPKPRTIGAGKAAVLTVTAKAGPEVEPGEHQLVFRLPARIGDHGFDLVASQSTKVGVSGESEILTAFGIPSLLVLPGFLLMAATSIFWSLRIWRKDWDAADYPFPLKEAPFWVFAVTFSIAAVLIARLLGTDFLGTYGLKEIIVTWLLSILAGFGVYSAYVVIRNIHRAARIPSQNDQPLDVLRKLAKQGLKLQRPRIAYDTGHGTSQLYLVQPESEARPSTWASPRINFSWTSFDHDLNERIQEQLDRSHDASALANSLAEGCRRKLLTVNFAADPNLPTLVPKEKLSIEHSEAIACQA